MKHTFLFLLIAVTAILFSCDDTTDTIGMSLTQNVNTVSISADTFFVESHSVAAKDIVSRATVSYLGKIKDPETNSYITCNFMSQFRPIGENSFPAIDNIYIENYDPAQPKEMQVKADSVQLVVYFNKCYGDSLALMKVTAHELAIPYEESTIYKTDFDPINAGMIRTEYGSIHSQMAYTISNRLHTDALRGSSSYVPYISFSLNNEYIDKNGVSYNNIGTYLMRKFYDKQTYKSFINDYLFIHDIFPGIYFESIGGIGSIGSVETIQIIVHFTSYIGNQKLSGITSFASTEEVLRKTNIKLSSLDNLINNHTCTYLKTPAGIFTELTLPIEKIKQGRENEMSGHENDTLNTVRLFIPRINDKSITKFNLPVPRTLLLLPTDSVNNFFKNKKVTDSRTSYTTTRQATDNGYSFANISGLVTATYKVLNDTINKVLAARKAQLGMQELTPQMVKEIKNEVTASYKSKHPTWNKVTLIPVETTYATLTSGMQGLTKVTYDMGLGSTRLIKGNADSDNIIVSVIYSKFND